MHFFRLVSDVVNIAVVICKEDLCMQVKPLRQRSRRTKSVPAELPSVEDALEEDVPEIKPRKRRGKEPDPNAPPVFGRSLLPADLHISCSLSACSSLVCTMQGHCRGGDTSVRILLYISGVLCAVVPGREVLEQALAVPPGPRPVPNLG